MIEAFRFDEIRTILGVAEPAGDLLTPEITEAIKNCPHRGPVSLVTERKIPAATCAVVEAARGLPAALGETICRRCRASSASFDPKVNAYLRLRIVKECYALAVSPPGTATCRHPDESQLDACIATVKALAGGLIAKRFIDTLYVYRSTYRSADSRTLEVDADKCVELLDRHGIAAREADG